MIFFFKHKTAYEMRISDWSSDVCSSDLQVAALRRRLHRVIADLVPALGMRADRGTAGARQQLGAEADAKERRAAFQPLRAEVDFLADEGPVVVVGAHRAAEDHAAGLVFEGRGQFLDKAGKADVATIGKARWRERVVQ